MDGFLIKILEKERSQLLLKLNMVEQVLDTFKNYSSIIQGQVLNDGTKPANSFQQDMQAFFKKYQQYNPTASTRNKLLFIIKAEKRFLHIREIAKIMQQLEDEISLSCVIKKVSPALSILKRIEGSPLVSIEVGNSHFNTFWGLNDWLDKNGGIINGFMYNQNEITKFQTKDSFAAIFGNGG